MVPARSVTLEQVWVGGCLEEVTSSFKNEKDSDRGDGTEVVWRRDQPKQAGRQGTGGRGTACPPS